MNRVLLTGNQAAAWGARLANVDYVPAFPITPQTEIIETLSDWIERGELSAKMVTLDSEHSMITAAGAAAATGVRVFTATSSQGLLHAMEMLYAVAGWRVPFVLVNVSRGLAAPITLEPDHNDVLAARDSGLLQFHCSSCQEVLDTILLAYRTAEDSRVRLPALVNLDGFYLSFTREPLELPSPEQVRAFLPDFDAQATAFGPDEPASQGVAVLGGAAYSYFRYQAHLASLAALDAYAEAARRFESVFGRRYTTIDEYRSDDASIAFVMIGSFSSKAREAVDVLRNGGHSVGLVRPRVLRPFPAETLAAALTGKRAVIVIDQNLSTGKGGILHAEIASLLYGRAGAPPILLSFVGGLGGRDIELAEFLEMARTAEHAVAKGSPPPPRLLFSSRDLRDVRRLQALAHALPVVRRDFAERPEQGEK
jgi:pyruvate ferredoxin oxidoreductase alpha subunit